MRAENEGGEGYDHNAVLAEEAAPAKAEALLVNVVNNFAAYRARWNAAAAKHGTNVPAIEREAGVSLLVMRAAKARIG